MSFRIKQIKSDLLNARESARVNFYKSSFHKDSYQRTANLFFNHVKADIEFTLYAPLYNPMQEIDLYPFLFRLLEQLVTLIGLFYLAFIYSTLALFFNCFIAFNLKELNDSFEILKHASFASLLVISDIVLNLLLLVLSPLTRAAATIYHDHFSENALPYQAIKFD